MQLLTNLFQDLRITTNSVKSNQTSVRAQNESHIDTLSEKIDKLYIFLFFIQNGVVSRIKLIQIIYNAPSGYQLASF